MIKSLATILALFSLSPILAAAEDEVAIDVRTQQVVAKYGVASKILRSFQQVKEPSTRADGRFLFRFDGQPGIQLILDRNYWVLGAWNAETEKEVNSYMFNPEDQQSALNVYADAGTKDEPDEDRSKEPGFTGVTYADGVVGGQKVRWQRWGDAMHLHSECGVTLPVGEKTGAPQQKMIIHVTANSEERRKALEDAMATLELH